MYIITKDLPKCPIYIFYYFFVIFFVFVNYPILGIVGIEVFILWYKYFFVIFDRFGPTIIPKWFSKKWPKTRTIHFVTSCQYLLVPAHRGPSGGPSSEEWQEWRARSRSLAIALRVVCKTMAGGPHMAGDEGEGLTHVEKFHFGGLVNSVGHNVFQGKTYSRKTM